MQRLLHNNIIKSLILVFTILNLTIAHANSKQVEDRKFEGYQIKFDYEKYPEEREIGYQYYLNERNNLKGIEKKDIGIDLFDIDNDGIKEIFVYVNGGSKCPRAGCPFAILKPAADNGRNYKKIPSFMETGASEAIYENNPPKVLNNITLGYHDLMFGKIGERVSIDRWNGKYYDIGEVINY